MPTVTVLNTLSELASRIDTELSVSFVMSTQRPFGETPTPSGSCRPGCCFERTLATSSTDTRAESSLEIEQPPAVTAKVELLRIRAALQKYS